MLVSLFALCGGLYLVAHIRQSENKLNRRKRKSNQMEMNHPTSSSAAGKGLLFFVFFLICNQILLLHLKTQTVDRKLLGPGSKNSLTFILSCSFFLSSESPDLGGKACNTAGTTFMNEWTMSCFLFFLTRRMEINSVKRGRGEDAWRESTW